MEKNNLKKIKEHGKNVKVVPIVYELTGSEEKPELNLSFVATLKANSIPYPQWIEKGGVLPQDFIEANERFFDENAKVIHRDNVNMYPFAHWGLADVGVAVYTTDTFGIKCIYDYKRPYIDISIFSLEENPHLPPQPYSWDPVYLSIASQYFEKTYGVKLTIVEGRIVIVKEPVKKTEA